ncbi:hypothetical protein D3C79_1039900 [compost metagenome]
MGAGVPANTGVAGASHRVEFFAGMPAPTGIAEGLKPLSEPEQPGDVQGEMPYSPDHVRVRKAAL